MIAELLHTGPAGAISGRDLSRLLGLTIREVTRQIEQERAEGAPICANSGYNPGYYLAEDRESMIEYCRRLEHRGEAIEATRKNCLKTVKKLPRHEDIALHLF